MNPDELETVATQFGVARAQVERDHLISHMLGYLSAPVRRDLVTKLVRGIQRLPGGLERVSFLIVVPVVGSHGLLIHHCADSLTAIFRDAASHPG